MRLSPCDCVFVHTQLHPHTVLDTNMAACRMAAAACVLLLLLFITLLPHTRAQYQPTWESLDARPLPAWYDESKFGIFVVWGVYSVPGFGSEWFWHYWRSGVKEYVDFMQKNYPPNFTYADFASDFKAEFFNPDEWADLLQASGAKYVVLTAKHHEGYTLWPSKYSFNWNAQDVGPRRDLVGDFANSIRKRTDIHLGLYHSLYEWYNPLYLQDAANHFTTQTFVQSKTLPELYELVRLYKPDVIWSDGSVGPYTYWNSTQFLAWLYNESPVKDTVVTNDRWGTNTYCKHGGYYTCSDRYNPGTLQNHKWENCMTIDKSSWGYRRNVQLSDFLTIEEIVATLAETISCGGNMLMNVGPTPDGRIIPVFEERLRQIGAWLKVNGEAVYSSQPWTHQNDTVTPGVWYTSKKTTATVVYAFVLKWPGSSLTLGAPVPSATTSVSLIGHQGNLVFTKAPSGGINIAIPALTTNQMPCSWGWVFRLQGLQNSKSAFKGYNVQHVDKKKLFN